MGVSPIPEPDDEAPFIVEPTIYRLTWPEGDPYHGLVVRVRSLPMGTFLAIAPQVDMLRQVQPEDLTTENIGVILEPFRMIGDHLVSWNLRRKVGDDVSSVPASFEGLLSQEVDLIKAIITAWVAASGTVSDPLGPKSWPGASDAQLAELMDLPMTQLPRSP